MTATLTEDKLLQEIINEAERIIEDTEYSEKGHYNTAAQHWQDIHFWIGGSMTVSATIASAGLLQDSCLLGGIFAVIATILGAIQTFINPQEKSSLHKTYAGSYLTLRNNTRIFKKIEMLTISDIEAREKIKFFSNERCRLNELSPAIPRWAYEQAKKDIEAGLAKYRVDKKGEE